MRGEVTLRSVGTPRRMGLPLPMAMPVTSGSGDEERLARLAARAWIAGRDGTVVQSGGTGGSILCPWTKAVIASGGICSAQVGVPGIGALRLYHGQGQRVGLFLNSTAPATQDVAVGTGSVAVSAIGSGYTLTTSAGTATISGHGAVTMGTTQIITVTGAGTITFTVAGTPVGACVNVEQNTFAGIKIITAGASVTRTADNILWTPPGAIPATTGEMYAIFVPYWSTASGAATPTGGAHRIWYESTTVDVAYINSTNGRHATVRTDAGGTQSAVSSAGIAHNIGVMEQMCVKWSNTALTVYTGATQVAQDVTLTNPWGPLNAIRISANKGSTGEWLYGATALIYDPTPTDATRAALARAVHLRPLTVLA
jgi:hypothetical protein